MTREVLCLIVLVAMGRGVFAQTPQPFPRPGTAPPPSTAAPAPQPRPQPPPSQVATPQPPPAQAAVPPANAGAPTEATLGFPIYPTAQFIASYDAGRSQRYFVFGATTPYAETRDVLPDGAQGTGQRGVQGTADAHVRSRPLQGGDDGVSTWGDDQGLDMGRIGRISEPNAGRSAFAIHDDHHDRPCTPAGRGRPLTSRSRGVTPLQRLT